MFLDLHVTCLIMEASYCFFLIVSADCVCDHW